VKPGSRKYAEWEQAIGQVKRGTTKAEVEKLLGTPSRVISPTPAEILSYRDEQIGDSVYGIRVAFTNDVVSQCYLGFELCDPKPVAAASRTSRYFQLFLVVLTVAIVMLLYAWLSAR
jgi:hypothetical protein